MLHFGIGYTPVMHGCITCDPYRGQIEVRGYANWFTIAFSCCFLMFPLAAPLCGLDLILPLFLFGVLSAIYWMQKRRFRQVEEALLRLWEQG